MVVLKKFVLFLSVLLAVTITALSCTTIVVTKGASVDGSVMVTHTADCGSCDFRLVRVPAMNFEAGTKRPVYPMREPYPRYVGTYHGEGYNTPGYEPTEPLGYIDQVEHTYAYMDAVYGVINEHQLAIGECTTAAKPYVKPTPGSAIFDVRALSLVAMERCTKARDAVQLMGELAVEYGYYGWGETFTVCDTEEAWVFEICGTPDKKSALWVATRVPDGTVFVEANEFRTREIATDDPENQLYSPNLHEVATAEGWWDPNSGELLDWLQTVSPGEYSHPYYSLRRVWSALRRIAPSMNFSPRVENTYTKDYPMFVKPDKKLSVQDVFALHRDYYQGTDYDLTKGLAAGPFGSPDRNGGNKLVKGAWERPISIFRCDYSWVAQLRDWLPDPIGGVLWFGPDAPHTTAYVPFYCGTTDLPYQYETGSHLEFDPEIAFWVHSFAGNWANLKFSYIIEDIKAMQKKTEDRQFIMQPAVEMAALELYKQDPQMAIDFLTDYSNNNAERVVKEWWDFDQMLIRKYNDGYVDGKTVDYPAWWLKEVGYEDGPMEFPGK